MLLNQLQKRSNQKCELCQSEEGLDIYTVPPKTDESIDNSILICNTCSTQINNPEQVTPNHWRCLNDSMWSETPAVQVMAWRMLNRLRSEGWPVELIEMLYLDDDTLAWAKDGQNDDTIEQIIHKDSNGVTLEAGDTVVLIKDLNVKGTSMVAKRGTAVRRISLVYDNAEQIEGKVDGQQIVILTQYVKKTN